MPKIPFAPAQKEEPFVPGAEPDVQSAGLPGAALARAAQNAASGLEQYGTVDLYLKRAEKVIKLSTARLDLDNDLHELKKRYETDTDYTNMPQKYATERQALIEKYQNQLGGEQDVWKAFEPTLNAKLDYTGTDVTYMARKGFIAESRATAIDNYERGVKRYAQTQDPRDRDNLLIDLENARQVGLFKPDEVRKMRDGIDNRAEVFKVEMMIEKNAPVADKYLNEKNPSGQYVNGRDLTIEQRSQLIRRSRHATDAYYHDIQSKMREQERVAKEQKKEAQNSTGDSFIQRYVAGTLTETDVLKSNLDPTGENSKEHWISKLRNRNNDPAGYVTDKILKADLYSRIVRDPEKVTDDEILNVIGKSDANGKGGLSEKDAKDLIDERRNRLKEPKDPAETAVYDNLKRDRKAGLFGKDSAGDLEYAKQVEAFKNWRKANPKEDPSTYYEKLTEPYKKSWISNMLEGESHMPWKDEPDLKKRREELTGKTPEKKPAGGGGSNKTLVGYKNGKPVYDIGGGNWQVGD